MNGKILTLAVSICVITSLSCIFAYNSKEKQSNPTELSAKIQSSQLDTNSEQEFFIKENTMNFIRLIGIEEKFGLTEPLKRDNFINTTLYLWGDEKDILNKQLKIIASNNSTTIDLPNLYKLTKDGHGDAIEKNILSTARENLSFTLPSDGLWTLTIYIGDILYGTAVIDVKPEVNWTEVVPL